MPRALSHGKFKGQVGLKISANHFAHSYIKRVCKYSRVSRKCSIWDHATHMQNLKKVAYRAMSASIALDIFSKTA